MRITDPIIYSSEVEAELRRGDSISNSAARTIAAWFQSPGRVGSVLAACASGAEFDYEELADDIAATLRAPWDQEARHALKALAEWNDYVAASND